MCLPAQEMQVGSLGQEDPLEKERATHFSILSREIPRTEETGGLLSMESQKSWMQLSNRTHTLYIYIYIYIYIKCVCNTLCVCNTFCVCVCVYPHAHYDFKYIKMYKTKYYWKIYQICWQHLINDYFYFIPYRYMFYYLENP